MRRRSIFGQEFPISPGQSSEDERISSVPQYEDVYQRTYDCSAEQKSKNTEIGCSGDSGDPWISPNKIGDGNGVLKKETNMSDKYNAAFKPLLEGTNPMASLSMNDVGCRALGTGSKSERILKLEKTVNRLKNALVSLEEENLNLNKKVKESIAVGNTSFIDDTLPEVTTNNNDKQEPDHSSPDTDLREASVSTGENHQEKQKQEGHTRITDSHRGAHQRQEPSCEDGHNVQEEEKREAQRRLQKVEEYCRECTRELGRVLRKYEEVRSHNKTLDKRNRQLTTDNQRLAEHLKRLEGVNRKDEETRTVLKENDRVKASLEEANKRCAQLCCDKEELEGRMTALSSEVSRLTEELAASRRETQRLCERSTLLDTEAKVTAVKMEEENKHLQDKLKDSEQKSEQSESAVRRLKEEMAELENCLHTVKRERDILQSEVRKLHQEYIDLSNNVSLQLRGKSSSAFSTSPGPHELSPLNFNSCVPRQDCPIGGEKIDQIRKRLEEEELKRAQRYQNIINQSV